MIAANGKVEGLAIDRVDASVSSGGALVFVPGCTDFGCVSVAKMKAPACSKIQSLPLLAANAKVEGLVPAVGARVGATATGCFYEKWLEHQMICVYRHVGS